MQSYNFDKIREIPNNISGVYSIVNSLNNNRYIGSSKDIRSRIYQHHYNLEKNKHHSIHLHIYNSISDAARELHTKNIISTCSNIVQCAKGKKNQAYKFKWKYYNDK